MASLTDDNAAGGNFCRNTVWLIKNDALDFYPDRWYDKNQIGTLFLSEDSDPDRQSLPVG